jgi:excinuclease ABC subunit B
LQASIAILETRMRNAAADLEFEEAARLRDEIKRLEALALGLAPPPPSPRRPKDRTPQPLGPGGGGYDPAQRRGKGGKKGR